MAELNKKQKSHLLAGISEGLKTRELNKRASEFDEPYSVSRQQVDFYRKTRAVPLKEIEQAQEQAALKEGFARKEERVRALNDLAERMRKELLEENRLWLPQVKSIGTGDSQQIIDFEEFNEAEIKQFRGVLDDIAKEEGERRQKVEHTGEGGGPLTIEIEYV